MYQTLQGDMETCIHSLMMKNFYWDSAPRTPRCPLKSETDSFVIDKALSHEDYADIVGPKWVRPKIMLLGTANGSVLAR